jgi:general nucleoside transport system permease protein
MSGALEIFATAGFWPAALIAAAPLLLAALGALTCGRAGVLNLGCEGLFVAGAVAAFLATRELGLPLAGAAAALAIGAAIGLLHGVLVSPFRLPQAPTGLAVTIAAAAVAQHVVDGLSGAQLQTVQTFAPVYLPALPDLPRAGEAINVARAAIDLLRVPLAVYLTFVLALVVAYMFNRTPLGLALRACGDNPDAVTTQGRSVHSLRVGADVIGSALIALGGALFVLAGSGALSFGLMNGRGFVALALAIAVGWRPGWALVAAAGLGIADAYQVRLQQLAGDTTGEFALLLPLVLALLILAATSRNVHWRLMFRRLIDRMRSLRGRPALRRQATR